MNKSNLAAGVVLLISVLPGAWAQSASSWRGIVLDQSTLEDVKAKLGEPSKAKENQKLYTVIDKWIDKSAKYTKLEYKPEGLKKANIYLSQGKVKAIELELEEKINPNALTEAYGVEMTPKVGGINLAMNPRDYERHEGKVYPKSYPTAYQLIGVSEPAFVVASVDNSSFGSALGGLMGAQSDGTSFPGKVYQVQLISGAARDTRGLDALK